MLVPTARPPSPVQDKYWVSPDVYHAISSLAQHNQLSLNNPGPGITAARPLGRTHCRPSSLVAKYYATMYSEAQSLFGRGLFAVFHKTSIRTMNIKTKDAIRSIRHNQHSRGQQLTFERHSARGTPSLCTRAYLQHERLQREEVTGARRQSNHACLARKFKLTNDCEEITMS
jgi:hypothetical protein